MERIRWRTGPNVSGWMSPRGRPHDNPSKTAWVFRVSLSMRGLEFKFLHAPVQKFCDVELAFRRACDFVDPSELA